MERINEEVSPDRLEDGTRKALAVAVGNEATGSTVVLNREAQKEKRISFAWLEITGKCQLECGHCYAESGPSGDHGSLEEEDWLDIIGQLDNAGVEMVQFIGGEPTLHPSLPTFVQYALQREMEVEIYTNLAHITPEMWELFSLPGVRLATSYYSPRAFEHELITNGRGSHERTRRNIIEAVQRGIRLRAGIIGILDDQQVTEAEAELRALGVEEIGMDDLRQIGRGVRERPSDSDSDEFCGNCGDGVVAVLANGAVQPCVFSRGTEYCFGNIRCASLESILDSPQAERVMNGLNEVFATKKSGRSGCNPPCRPVCTPNCKPSAGEPCQPECMPRCLPNSKKKEEGK